LNENFILDNMTKTLSNFYNEKISSLCENRILKKDIKH